MLSAPVNQNHSNCKNRCHAYTPKPRPYRSGSYGNPNVRQRQNNFFTIFLDFLPTNPPNILCVCSKYAWAWRQQLSYHHKGQRDRGSTSRNWWPTISSSSWASSFHNSQSAFSTSIRWLYDWRVTSLIASHRIILSLWTLIYETINSTQIIIASFSSSLIWALLLQWRPFSLSAVRAMPWGDDSLQRM